MTKVSKINSEWHKHNRLPKDASIEERVYWHLEHLKNCQCRKDMPEKLKLEMKKKGIIVPV